MNSTILALKNFERAYLELVRIFDKEINELKSINNYPFEKSFDEYDISKWINNSIQEIEHGRGYKEPTNLVSNGESENELIKWIKTPNEFVGKGEDGTPYVVLCNGCGYVQNLNENEECCEGYSFRFEPLNI
ncbi:hypothetical protein [Bacillus weihaiensis]|uniref:Uncharacterized protein n=1 Tax=Bacillus weihaiensis TaxID=1547283 RepID=A0A1L3MRI1_9BACI|nr:hypothetical protein [Bacillus weihaiensis]APH04932.1 hypothetical protein A9C19_09320 [Bacillus weihaiensis]